MGHLAGNMVTRTEAQIRMGPMVAMDEHRKGRCTAVTSVAWLAAMMRALKETWLPSVLDTGANG